MKKNCLFQYATAQKIIEDTGLITLKEAEGLWEKYQSDIKSRWNDDESPEMCIWIECDNDHDYSLELKDIDYRDCELASGRFYKVTKTLIK